MRPEIPDPARATHRSPLTAHRPPPTTATRWQYETVKMTAAEHRESADINLSLMALKDCFRAYHHAAVGSSATSMNSSSSASVSTATPKPWRKQKVTRPATMTRSEKSTASFKRSLNDPLSQAPYRASALTRVLRKCFQPGTGQNIAVIGCVSGNPYHSSNAKT